MSKSKAPSGRLPAPGARSEEGEFNDFLKASDIGDLDTKAVLDFTGHVRGPEDSEFGERIIPEVRYDRKTWDFSIKTNSANYRLLHDRFGADPKKWRGKVNVVIKHFASNDYIAVMRQK